MKNNSFWEFVFNPFTRIAGWQAFAAGLAFAAMTGIVATLSGVAFDGVLDAHVGTGITYALSFIFIGIDIASITLVMWIAALVTSRDFRFIDILGTMTLARAPMLLVAIAGFTSAAPDPAEVIANPTVLITGGMLVFLLFCIVATIWYIVLIYNAMKVSCNIGGTKLAVTVVVALILAEVLSKVVIYWVLAE